MNALDLRSRALAHAVPTGETDLPIQIHGENTPALPVARKGLSGRVLLRPQRDYPAATVADFSTAVPTFPAICSALNGDKLQQLAKVPVPTHTEPNPSSSTVFTYQLGMTEGQQTMTSEPSVKMPFATNLILYGPPGTGKTYATAWEAVRLCIGDDAAAQLRSDRDALMAEYRRLASEGRIEFVTFHQSFSYEDFVEGLRPTTETELADDEQGGTVASGGFSLKAHAGVFKVISERARLDTGNAVAKRLDRSRPIYKIALGQRGSQEDRIRKGLDQSLIHIGWGGDIDWSDDRFDDFEEIRKEWNAKKDPNASGKDPNIEMTFAFRSGLQIGDYVIISDGRDSYRAVDAGLVLAGVEPPQRSLAKTRTVKGGQVAAAATVLGLTGEAVRQIEPAIPLLQMALQFAPWIVGAAALAGIAYMIWARIDDRQRGLR